MLSYDESELFCKIERLPKIFQTAFALACAQRLQPAYLQFAEKTARSDAAWVVEISSRLWRDLEGESMPVEDLQGAVERCGELIPGEDQEPWGQGQAYADDAVSSLMYAITSRLSGGVQEVIWASRRAYDSIDHYVVSRSGGEEVVIYREDEIKSHPLVQAELARQVRDIDDLLAADAEDLHSAVSRIKKRAEVDSQIFFG